MASTVTSSNLESHPTVLANRAVVGPDLRTARPSRKRASPPAQPVGSKNGAQRNVSARQERQQLQEHAQRLLGPLASMEMLCDADEKMENAIFYMNRAALDAMKFNHKRLNPLLRGADVRKAARATPFTSFTRIPSASAISSAPWWQARRPSTRRN